MADYPITALLAPAIAFIIRKLDSTGSFKTYTWLGIRDAAVRKFGHCAALRNAMCGIEWLSDVDADAFRDEVAGCLKYLDTGQTFSLVQELLTTYHSDADLYALKVRYTH